jgi:hypothetical protein
MTRKIVETSRVPPPASPASEKSRPSLYTLGTGFFCGRGTHESHFSPQIFSLDTPACYGVLQRRWSTANNSACIAQLPEVRRHLASPDIALLRLFSSWPLFGWETRSDSLYPGCAPRDNISSEGKQHSPFCDKFAKPYI